MFFVTNVEFSFFDFWGYQILYYFLYNGVSSIYLAYLIISLRSKYSTIAALRIILLNVFFEVPFVLLFLTIYVILGEYSFDAFIELDSSLILISPIAGILLLIYVLYEAKRAPFDHTEAESELVAGHLIEFGGRTLLVFFICEYIHVFFGVFFIVTFVIGDDTAFDTFGEFCKVHNALLAPLE